MVTLLIRNALDLVYPCSVMSYRHRFFDAWTKTKTKLTQKGLQANLGKTAKKAKIIHISWFFSLTKYQIPKRTTLGHVGQIAKHYVKSRSKTLYMCSCYFTQRALKNVMK